MKYLLMLVLAVGAYQLYQSRSSSGGEEVDALQAVGSHVAIYGRDSCPVTQQMKAFMREHKIEFEYFTIDDTEIEAVLHQRMEQQGLSTQHYNLPVVDFGGELVIRPSKSDILDHAEG
jgi:glutaredoxin